MPEAELWDRLVNSKWPADKNLIPTDQEAIRGAKRLYKKAMGRPWKGEVKITSGNRHTWIRRRVMFVNPNYRWHRGWPGIVHDLSHWAHHKKNPNDRPHSSKQAYIERDLVDYLLAQGWLDGALKPKPSKPKPDIVVLRYQRILDREARWKSKLSRAENALTKATKERRDYERRHGERLTT